MKVFGESADFCNRYLTKGRKVAVEGSVQIRSYDAQDGSKRYVTEIIAQTVEAVGSREEGQQQPADAHGASTMPAQQQRMDMNWFSEVDPGDDLPFE